MPEAIDPDLFWQWYARSRLAGQAADIPLGELDWLIGQYAGIDRLALRLQQLPAGAHLSAERLNDLDRLWQQRLTARTPVQYLVGGVAWRQFELCVTPAVLIPRPETEEMVDLAREVWERGLRSRVGNISNRWADLGTGSGAIAIGLADVLPDCAIVAVDRSEAALAVARQNATRCGVSDRVRFCAGNWCEPLAAFAPMAGIVSNPPYIPTAELDTLQPEVRDWEPRLALDGGEDGLAAIRHLIDTAPPYLVPGGVWLVEVMAGQATAVMALLQAAGRYAGIASHRDRAGIERFVSAFAVGGTMGQCP